MKREYEGDELDHTWQYFNERPYDSEGETVEVVGDSKGELSTELPDELFANSDREPSERPSLNKVKAALDTLKQLENILENLKPKLPISATVREVRRQFAHDRQSHSLDEVVSEIRESDKRHEDIIIRLGEIYQITSESGLTPHNELGCDLSTAVQVLYDCVAPSPLSAPGECPACGQSDLNVPIVIQPDSEVECDSCGLIFRADTAE